VSIPIGKSTTSKDKDPLLVDPLGFLGFRFLQLGSPHDCRFIVRAGIGLNFGFSLTFSTHLEELVDKKLKKFDF
jgi:hypothetical protein